MRSSRWVRWLLAPVVLGLLSGAVAGGVIEIARAIRPRQPEIDIVFLFIFIGAWIIGAAVGGRVYAFSFGRIYHAPEVREIAGSAWTILYLLATFVISQPSLLHITLAFSLFEYALLGGFLSSICVLAIGFGLSRSLRK